MSFVIFLILLVILGANFLFVAFFTSLQVCPPPTVEYRFIPRTFNEEQESPVSIIDQMQTIFDSKTLLT